MQYIDRKFMIICGILFFVLIVFVVGYFLTRHKTTTTSSTTNSSTTTSSTTTSSTTTSSTTTIPKKLKGFLMTEIEQKEKKYLSWSSGFSDDNLNQYNSKDDKDDRKWAVWGSKDTMVELSDGYLKGKINGKNKFLNFTSGVGKEQFTGKDKRKFAAWSDDDGIVVKLDKNGYLSSDYVVKGSTYYLSWSSGYEKLDDNRKWAVWQLEPENKVQFHN